MRLRPAVLLAAGAVAAAAPARAGEIPNAVIVLESFAETLPGYVPEAAPPRFVLLEDGQVFVGGTSQLRAGKLGGQELRDLDKQVADVRKLPGLGGSVQLGPGAQRFRLTLRKGRPLEMNVTGDPAKAVAAFQALGQLLQNLLRFDDPSLRPFAPASFAVLARDGKLPGGCRAWPFPEPPSTFVPRVVTAEEAASWPKGAAPASVCLGEKTLVVAFRPLLPGERY
jgi:hypothetical protein